MEALCRSVYESRFLALICISLSRYFSGMYFMPDPVLGMEKIQDLIL